MGYGHPLMFRIAKTFTFSAAHHLDGLPAGHPCERPHGHNYRVDVELEGELDQVGMVQDYRDMDPFRNWLDRVVDHRDLNEVMVGNPTAERLAVWFHGEAQMVLGCPVSAVRVHETDRTVAEYRP